MSHEWRLPVGIGRPVRGVSGLESQLAIGDVAISGLALAAVIGVVVNLVLPLSEEDEEVVMAKDIDTTV